MKIKRYGLLLVLMISMTLISCNKENAKDIESEICDVETEQELEILTEDTESESMTKREESSTENEKNTEEIKNTESNTTPDTQKPVPQKPSSQKPAKETYTYKLYTDHMDMESRSVYKESASVYDEPSSSGKVIDTFGYKHLMFIVGKCNETGWYKVVYDDDICAESNYENHWKVIYDYDSQYPAATPESNRIIFSRTAQNIKTGYVNPKDVKNLAAWEDEIYHVWNGVKFYEWYNISEEAMKYYKELCYAGYFKIVERDGRVGMLIPDPDAPSQKGYIGMYFDAQDMLDEYIEERGYIWNGGGGGWIDSTHYHVYVDYLKPADEVSDYENIEN